ncbi:MAG: SLBB domain-containing protein [Planctomycetes bacterium]|nr:SLBB domain-containing protein [Planctomycetota bacterium]
MRMVLILTLAAVAALGASAATAVEPAPPAAIRAAAPSMAPGDLVRINVYDHPDLELELRIPASGSVDFPLIGAIEPNGRSVDDLAAELRRRLMDGYIREANVTVTVSEFAPRTIYVLGAVGKPTALPLDPNTVTTAVQAIAAAGGLTADADRASAQVVRETAGGQRESLPIPASEDALRTHDVVLRPNDLVVVPRLGRAFVSGQVAEPGPIALPSDEPMTVSRAISMSGGFDRFAKQSKVQLIRSGAGARTIDVSAILSGKGDEDPELLPGDMVYVPESRF